MNDGYQVVNGEYVDLKNAKIYWDTAIGLQQVDNLFPSPKLYELVEDHLMGKKNYAEVEESLHEYYAAAPEKPNFRTREADLVSVRIAQLLNDTNFRLTKRELLRIHQFLFKDIFPQGLEKYVGRFRDVNIRKEEEILGGLSVRYSDYRQIEENLDYDIHRENLRTIHEQVDHIPVLSRFVSNIWNTHPFREGNTRATAVYILKYLRQNRFRVDNTLFKNNSKYFRDALVLASDNEKEWNDYRYLESFFQKLLVDSDLELPAFCLANNDAEDQ